MRKIAALSLFLLFIYLSGNSQTAPKPYRAIPTERQLRWQETEVYCIIHFSMATFADKEWGYGDEKLSSFRPSALSALQILNAAKLGGLKGVVVVAKHHDGFCLWPTKSTDHNIANTPYKNGKGDIVKEYQLACEKLGLKMGVYCSPWDRNSAVYGQPSYVTNVYRKQLTELYSNYGKLFLSWHDGANGGDGYYGGAKELRKIDKETYYDWNNTWKITRALQPCAVIFGDGDADIRWVGNEEGVAGDPCWETFNPYKVPSYAEYSVNGTRHENRWMPAECDVPLRPGWFYHKSEDGKTKTPYQLVDLYYKSVGRGACLDLGLAPDTRGLLNNEDVNSLKGFGDIIRATFAKNLAQNAKFYPSNIRGNNNLKYGTRFLTDNDRYSYWATDDKVNSATLLVKLKKPETFNIIRLRENIKLGQRLDSIKVEIYKNNSWEKVAIVSSIGANRLIRLKQNIITTKVRFSLYAPVCIALSDVGLYKEPVHLTAPIIRKDKDGLVEIYTEAPVKALRYTIDGSAPNINSKIYTGPFTLNDGGIVQAVSFEEAGIKSSVASKTFDISKKGWKISGVDFKGKGSAVYQAIDDNEQTFWHEGIDTKVALSQGIVIDMDKQNTIHAFTYLPRQDKQTDGIVDSYVFETSEDGKNWSLAAEGEFSNISSNPIQQVVPLKTPLKVRYLKFTARRTINNTAPAIAEIGVRE